MCVFLRIHVLKIVVERLFWEIIVLIGSLVKLYVGLHSYLCFSPLKKLFWKAGSTPPRYLAICRTSQTFFLLQSWHLLNTWWIDQESSCLLDSSSIPSGSIELLFLDLIPCCSIPQLSTTIFSTPTSTPLETSSVEHYWRVYIYFLVWSISYFFDLSVPVHLSNTLISLQSCSSRFLQAFSSFSTLGKLLISHSSCISCFET